MEKVPQKSNSAETIALVLIGIGLLLIVKEMGGLYFFPDINLHGIFSPIRNAIHNVGGFIFSWPMILIVIGLLLMSGNRKGGLVLLIIGAIFILPKIIVLSVGAMFVLFPLVLIALGIALVTRLL
jgi:hypothetical protein